MRLWHKDLISVLPKQQLAGEWRECSAISKSLSSKGTPNHILVNKITEYPICEFLTYCDLVAKERQTRGYKTSDSVKRTIRENSVG